MFLNCNYPDKCKIPKGKPKELKKSNVKFEIKAYNSHLFITNDDKVYFQITNDRGYYWGIDLKPYFDNPNNKNMLNRMNWWKVICSIERDLIDWSSGLGNGERDILIWYLRTLNI